MAMIHGAKNSKSHVLAKKSKNVSGLSAETVSSAVECLSDSGELAVECMLKLTLDPSSYKF